LSNLKNALKSGSSGVAAIDDLSGQFDGLETLVRGLVTPEPDLVRLLVFDRNDRERAPINTVFMPVCHNKYLTCNNLSGFIFATFTEVPFRVYPASSLSRCT
jgi:hypothetical protein